MSDALYDSLVEKWQDFLDQTDELKNLAELIAEDDADDTYDELVREFCKKHGYSEKTMNMAFYDRWWDTFADMYYQKLEDEGVKIIHDNPQEGDWDYGKKFHFDLKYGWVEITKEQLIHKPTGEET